MERNKSAKIKNSAEKSSGEILPRDTEGNLMKSVAQTIIEADRFYTIAAKTGSVIQAVESVKDGGNIRLGKYERKPEQEWAFVREGDGVYRIRNRASGKLIDLMMTGTANGTWLHLWEDVGGTSQMWKMEPTPAGTVRLRSMWAAGKCIDTVGMGTADGAVLQIWQETAGEDQLWTISEVKDRAKHAPKAEEKPAEVKAEAAAPAEEKPVEEKAAPAVKKTTRKPAAKKTAAKTAAKSAGAKAEAAPAKAEEKPAGEPQAVITGNVVTAPLPGRVIELKVKVGDAVKAGQEVAVLEAMKMENAITSDFTGTVKQILVRQGQTVATDAVLMEIG